MANVDARCPLCASVFCLRADAERCRHTGQRRPVAASPVEASVPAEAPEEPEAPADAGEVEENAPEPAPVALEALTVAQLRELAKEREVEVDSRATKAELIEALS